MMQSVRDNKLARILFFIFLPLAFFACGDESDYLLDSGMSYEVEEALGSGVPGSNGQNDDHDGDNNDDSDGRDGDAEGNNDDVGANGGCKGKKNRGGFTPDIPGSCSPLDEYEPDRNDPGCKGKLSYDNDNYGRLECSKTESNPCKKSCQRTKVGALYACKCK